MVAIVEAIDLVVGDPRSTPFSVGVAPGEIVGLLFPPARPRTPVLRALAGLDGATAGEVRFPSQGRVAIASGRRPLADALSTQPDLVLLDAATDLGDRGTWALLAAERALGTSFVVATASVDEACRSDRVSLALWDMTELSCAIGELVREMTSRVQEFLALLGESQHRRSAVLAADLRRLNVGARALVAEMRRCASDGEGLLAWKAAAEDVNGAALSDRVLEAVIVEELDR
jgi:hypothetical protein